MQTPSEAPPVTAYGYFGEADAKTPAALEAIARSCSYADDRERLFRKAAFKRSPRVYSGKREARAALRRWRQSATGQGLTLAATYRRLLAREDDPRVRAAVRRAHAAALARSRREGPLPLP